MLYLIKQENKDFNLLKIGYTSNLEARMSSYKTHNPTFILLDVVGGEKSNEKELHEKLEKFKYQTEWFYENNEVLNIWEEYSKNNPINNSDSGIYYWEYLLKYISRFKKEDFDPKYVEEPWDIIHGVEYSMYIAPYKKEKSLLIHHKIGDKETYVIPIYKLEFGEKDNQYEYFKAYKINNKCT